MPRSGARILLIGGDADHNVGDRAIVSAVASCLAGNRPGTEIAVVAGPGEGPPIRGVTSVVPRGPTGMARLLRTAAVADQILIAGGGLFQDDDSRAKMPYWAARILLLKSVNPRIAGHSIGAGPLRSPEGRAAAALACAALTSVSVRDRFARDVLASCVARPVEIVPDPAFMLEPAPRQASTELLRHLDLRPDRPMIAVALRRWYHDRGGFVPNAFKARAGLPVARDEQRYGRLLDVLGDALRQLAARLEASVLLLPSYNVGHEADDAACAALARRLGDVQVRMARIMEPGLYKAVLGHASLVLSSRMHPLILAAGMGVPLVGLSYNDKFGGMFDQLGIPARSLPLDEFPARWGAQELLAQAVAALEAGDDLRHRAELLGATARQRTLEVAFAPARDATVETVDA